MKIFSADLLKIAKKPLLAASVTSLIISSQMGMAAPGDKVHAYFADEHNTTPTSSTGNRILEIDIENMTLVNEIPVPGTLGHHADNGFNSKVYGVPKASGYVNVVELRKDQNGSTSMNNTKKIDLIHKPRSGDAYNKKFNVILMVAANRPMGSFINVETDKVVGTIGENVNCRLTDGSMLLSHSDANTISGATKYHCATVNGVHGGSQISGHPYWLTPDYAAVVDRANNQISVYYVWKEGSQLKSKLINHLATRSSIHQIIPRDRTDLPLSQQADFYATEEGVHATSGSLTGGVAHALLKMKLTTNGLILVKRMDLQRTIYTSPIVTQAITNMCNANYLGHNVRFGRTRTQTYLDLFARYNIPLNPDQDSGVDYPVECFYQGVPGGHNADFAPNNKHVYVGMAGGAMSIIDVNRWKIVNNLTIGSQSGTGHTCFSKKYNLALTTNHGKAYTSVIRGINSNRPTISQKLLLGFSSAGLLSTKQSHTCYIDEKEEFYYNFWTDGGVFYKMNLANIAANTRDNNRNMVSDSLYTGGIPIQGSYIRIKDIKSTTPQAVFRVNNDSATSSGAAVTIDVLANDTGSSLDLEYVDHPYYGQTQIVNGKIKYTPNAGFVGTDDFWYGVSSPGLGWKWGLVTVTVAGNPPSVPFIVNNDSASTTAGNAVTIDVLANDTGNGLILGWIDSPYVGTALMVGNKIRFTPNAGFTGTTDFWYEVYDSTGTSKWANVFVTVTGNGTVFSVQNDRAKVKRGRTITIDVLANDTGNDLYLAEVDSVWTGSVRKSNNKIVYTAASNFTGTIDIWHGVEDASGTDKWAKVTVTVY